MLSLQLFSCNLDTEFQLEQIAVCMHMPNDIVGSFQLRLNLKVDKIYILF